MSFVSISRNPFRSVLGFLFGYWFRQKWLVVGIVACVAGSTAADVLMPVYAGRIINAVASAPAGDAQAGHDALLALAAIVVLGALAIITRFLSISGIVRLTLCAMRDMARDAFWRVQRFSSDWHANSFSGSVVRRISRGMWSADLLNDTLLLALLPSCIVLAGSTILLGLHWPVMGVLVAVASVAYVALASGISLFYVVPAARLSNAWDTRVGGAMADAVSCNAVVKAFGTEAREDALLDKVLRKWQRRTHRTWMRSTLDGTVQGIALLVLRVAIMGTALLLWWRGQASAGDLTYVLATSFVIQGYLRDMGVHVTDLQRGVNEMEELVAIQDHVLGVADRPDARPIRIHDGAVSFDRVTFHYGGHRTPLFRDFSLNIRGGERVGLVGHSGSGKTTFVKLVQRLHDVTSGRILIDGQDISTVAQASLRRQIAIVPQEPVLFHRSLAENIAYARPDATQEEIERAARLANAHDFIARLPKGYATLVGERGVKLSGGERQRVALARAFLADAPILILDEATASLDSESEALIQQAMERLMAGRTVIVIAHRLSTVRALDRILVFDRGRVVEEGDHVSLVHRPGGIYRRLFERQALGMVEHARAA